MEKQVAKRENISVFKSVFLTAKIISEFYRKSDPKNFQVMSPASC
jgi:hypothetical protein